MNIAPITTTITSNGELSIGGCTMSQLAEQFGTPFYLIDKATLLHRCREYTSALANHYPNALATYAGKANICVGLLNIVADEGLGLDVVSGGELYTALKSRMPKDRIYFHGNYKSDDELLMALEHNIKIMVDNEKELEDIIRLTTAHQKTAQLLLRLKPEIDAHTHEYIRTGQLDSKFGIDKSHIGRIIEHIKTHPQLTLLGIHGHIGSQIFDNEPFIDLAHQTVDFMKEIHDTHGITFTEISLGGGAGVRYTDSDDPKPVDSYIGSMITAFKDALQHAKLPEPKVLIEPGRSIIAQAGVTVYKAGAIKEIPGVKTYLVVDGGMGDNIRFALYQADHTIVIANKANQEATHTYDITGRYCEQGDMLAENKQLPQAEPNDIVVFYGTGAYNYSMACNYNRVGKLPTVIVDNGHAELLIKQQSYDDLIAQDVY